jgi:hypothetical protein
MRALEQRCEGCGEAFPLGEVGRYSVVAPCLTVFYAAYCRDCAENCVGEGNGQGGNVACLPWAPRRYALEERPRGCWQRAEGFEAATDAEALLILEAEICRAPLRALRLVEEWQERGVPCARVVREHVEG